MVANFWGLYIIFYLDTATFSMQIPEFNETELSTKKLKVNAGEVMVVVVMMMMMTITVSSMSSMVMMMMMMVVVMMMMMIMVVVLVMMMMMMMMTMMMMNNKITKATKVFLLTPEKFRIFCQFYGLQ